MSIPDELIVLFATCVGILYLIKLRNYDVYEKEPFLKLFLVAALGGAIAVATSLLIYGTLKPQYTFIDAVFKIGVVEELAKFFALIILFKLIDKDFNEIVDGIIYISAIALGFATIENMMYAFRYQGSMLILLQRSIYPIIGHMTFSGYMGIAFFIHRKVHDNKKGLALAMVLSILAHGFYDGVLFQVDSALVFHALFIGLLVAQFMLLRTALGFSTFIKKFDYELFVIGNKKPDWYCNHCEKPAHSNNWVFGKINLIKCPDCGNAVFDHHNALLLLDYFRPLLNAKKFLGKLIFKGDLAILVKGEGMTYHRKHKTLYGSPGELAIWLAGEGDNDRRRELEKPVFGPLLRALGLKYMV